MTILLIIIGLVLLAVGGDVLVRGAVGISTRLGVSVTFLLSLGLEVITQATVGLLIGGVVAAPFGAIIAKSVPAKP